MHGSMYGCMDVWMYMYGCKCIDVCLYGCLDVWMYGYVNGCVWMYECMLDSLMYTCMDRCMNV